MTKSVFLSFLEVFWDAGAPLCTSEDHHEPSERHFWVFSKLEVPPRSLRRPPRHDWKTFLVASRRFGEALLMQVGTHDKSNLQISRSTLDN